MKRPRQPKGYWEGGPGEGGGVSDPNNKIPHCTADMDNSWVMDVE